MNTTSEEYRHECEARTLLSWPMPKRKAHLCLVENKRGMVERRRLENTVYRMWVDRQVDQLMAMNPRDQIVHLTRLERAGNSRNRGDVEQALERRQQAANDNQLKAKT